MNTGAELASPRHSLLEGIVTGIPRGTQRAVVDGIVSGVPLRVPTSSNPVLMSIASSATPVSRGDFGSGMFPQSASHNIVRSAIRGHEAPEAPKKKGGKKKLVTDLKEAQFNAPQRAGGKL